MTATAAAARYSPSPSPASGKHNNNNNDNDRGDADDASRNYASYVPHDLGYKADFEDALLHTVLDFSGPETDSGIRIIPDDSEEQAVEGVSVRARDIDARTLPRISEAELPLSLEDPRRVFAGPVRGVKLTHPGGYLEGGPGLDPEMDTFPDDFLANNPKITTPDALRDVVGREIERNMEVLRDRLEARRRAKERNEQVEKELKTLTEQHEMELRIQSRMAEEVRKKREVREQRRREGDGGGQRGKG